MEESGIRVQWLRPNIATVTVREDQEAEVDLFVSDKEPPTEVHLKDCREASLKVLLPSAAPSNSLKKVVVQNCYDCEFYFVGASGTESALEEALLLEVIGCEQTFVSLKGLLVPIIAVDDCGRTRLELPDEWPGAHKNAMIMACASTKAVVAVASATKRFPIPDGDWDITLQQIVRRKEDGSFFSGELKSARCVSARDRLRLIAELCSGQAERDVTPSDYSSIILNTMDSSLLEQALPANPEDASLRRGHGSEEEIEELFDAPEVLKEKIAQLAKLIKESKYTVAYTGAGVSTSANIPDYRGPQGCWTQRDRGEVGEKKSLNLMEVVPTPTHMSLVKLVDEGLVKHVISTNLDGLHCKSGLKRGQNLTEVHGNCFIEYCPDCGAVYEREEDVGGMSLDHTTGNMCDDEDCRGELVDNIINFGEGTKIEEWDEARFHSNQATLALVLGTSLKVPSACYLPEVVYQANGGTLVIVNLQRTPFDQFATLRIFAQSDLAMQMLAEELNIKVPQYNP
ncbi:NAD-dependent protein deacetylase sirtuin-7 [Balamuthia mandrillaris]